MLDPNEFFTRHLQIETERLLLRQIEPRDADDMYEYSCQPEVTKYLLWSSYVRPEQAVSYIDSIQKSYHAGGYYDMAVVLKSENKMIGTCGLTHVNTRDGVSEIGFVLNPVYHRQGYGYEAALAMMRFSFIDLNCNRVEAKCMRGNTASRALMQKLGMQYEGCARQLMYVKGQYRDIETCSILAGEFRRHFGSESAHPTIRRGLIRR